jgi:hypothetical protein
MRPHAEQGVRRRGALGLEDRGERERSQQAQQGEHARGQLAGQLPSLGAIDAPDTADPLWVGRAGDGLAQRRPRRRHGSL